VAANQTVPLPPLAPRKTVKHHLGVIRKFLTQHPGAEQALAHRFGKNIVRAVLDPEGEVVDRARAGLYFARWFPERQGEWTHVLQMLWEHGLSVTDLSGEDEQIALLQVSHRVGVEADAILSGLDSRYSTVRAEADRLRAELAAAGSMSLNETLLKHAPRYPLAALRLIEEEVTQTTPRFDGWRLLQASLTLIEDRPKPSTAEKILRWLAPEGAFARLLAGRDCPDDARLRLRVLLRQWRSSDRFLFPALEALERLGLGEIVAAVRSDRVQKAARLFEGVGKQAEDADVAVMTRATWERLRIELERMERELKTTIPATIQKARELGDLKENAEYHSAKLKQANMSKLVAALQLRLQRARFVDELEYRDGTVGVGMEVVLEAPDEVVTYWILGDEEHHHGANVISFQAPIGRALVGHSIGDSVELGEGDARKAFRVVSVERRLPQHEGKTTA
jgi:transcription elongation factor GreA